MPPAPPRRRGSFWQRISIWFLSFWLAIFVFGFLGFVVQGIGDAEAPKRADVEEDYVEASLIEQIEELEDQQRDLQREISNRRETQQIQRASMNESRAAMNQLVEIHRLNLEKDVTPTEAEQEALAESQRLYLASQTAFQTVNEEIAQLNTQAQGVAGQLEDLGEERKEQAEPVDEEYRRRLDAYRLRIAIFKLAFILPVLIAAAWFAQMQRRGPYAPIAWSALIAAFWRVGVVAHRWFPQAWFNYAATGVAIAVILVFMVQMIRMAVRPRLEGLLKQYRDAYNRRRCPICEHPIRRGPLKYADWSGKVPTGVVPIPRDGAGDEDEPYACPSCGAQLYEKCGRCETVRHSLLPFCEGCGEEKAVGPKMEEAATPGN